MSSSVPDPVSGVGGTWLEALGGLPVTKLMVVIGFVSLAVVAFVYHWLKDRAAKGVGGPIGGLSYVVGTMGSGKSMFGVKMIVQALVSGKYVVTNCALLPGWSEKVVDWYLPTRNQGERAARARCLEGLYIYEQSILTAMRYRPPCAKCGASWEGSGLPCGHSGSFQEGRAFFVWDETHNDLNNRDWDGAGDSKEERQEDKRRKRLLIRWATQLRKLGYVGYLLSQHHENTDKQLQRVCNFIIRVQNQRNSEGVWLARLLPPRFALFLVFHYPAHLATDSGSFGRQAHTKFERYFLPRERHLYDSWATYHGIDDESSLETSPIALPSGGRPQLVAVPADGRPRSGLSAG